MAVLLDTHTWAWAIDDAPRLSRRAIMAIEAADRVFVASVSFYEICQKVRLGKWPEMAGHAADLKSLAAQQDIVIAPLTPEVATMAGLLKWAHRDPFDRILAATAVDLGMDFISADTSFDEVQNMHRIW